jgi:hypothetical protein
MAVLDHDRRAIQPTISNVEADGSRYSVRRCVAIVGGLSVGFWAVLGLIVYRVF